MKIFSKINISEEIVLCDKEGFQIAKMEVECIWEPNFDEEAQKVYGTLDKNHPGVNFLQKSKNTVYLGGNLKKSNFLIIMIIKNIDFLHVRLKKNLKKKAGKKS